MGYIRGFVHGAVVGGIVGLCVAPQPGPKTRKQIMKFIDTARDNVQKAQDTARKVTPLAQDAAKTMSDKAGFMRNSMEKIWHHETNGEAMSVNATADATNGVHHSSG